MHLRPLVLGVFVALLVLAPVRAHSTPFFGGGAAGSTTAVAAYASCGSGSSAGDLCITTDSPITLRVWDGSAWDDCVGGYGCSDPIPTTGWTVEGTAHTLSTDGGIRVYSAVASGVNAGGHTRAAGTSDFRYELLVSRMSSSTEGGILVYLTSSTSAESLGLQITATQVLWVRRPNGPTDSTGQTFAALTFDGWERLWVAVEHESADVGTEIKLEVSADGVVWTDQKTEAVATSFPSGAPDELFFGMDSGATWETASSLYLLKELPL